VRAAIAQDTQAVRRGTCRATILDPYLPFIRDTLVQYPRLRATRLFEMVRGRGYPGSVVQLRRLVHTPRAIGPITSITLDQMGQGIVLVLSLFVFRDRFEQGVASFSNLIGAGGLGVLAGIATVGMLEQRFSKERIVAGSFVIGGITLIAVGVYITPVSVLVASFAVGLTFAWKKIPVDTLVQESLPDGYRGRVPRP